YSSTHSGRMRRFLPSLTDRSSPVATSILVLLRPKPSSCATWATLYHFGASSGPARNSCGSLTGDPFWSFVAAVSMPRHVPLAVVPVLGPLQRGPARRLLR